MYDNDKVIPFGGPSKLVKYKKVSFFCPQANLDSKHNKTLAVQCRYLPEYAGSRWHVSELRSMNWLTPQYKEWEIFDYYPDHDNNGVSGFCSKFSYDLNDLNVFIIEVL